MTLSQTAAIERHAGARSGAAQAVLAIGLALTATTWRISPSATPMLVVLGLYLAISAVVISQVAATHPFPRFGAANAVTLLRAAMVCFLALFLAAPLSAQAYAAFALSSAILALDGVDGWLARRQAMTSRFGARFDMEIDALLIMMLCLIVHVDGKAGAWVLLLGLMRYGFVAAGRVLPALAGELFASQRRKSVCVVQIVVLTVLTLPAIASPWSDIVAAAALLLLAWSFAIDTRWLLRPRPPS